MRLTLRTMLAHMDEVLEPEDQATLGKKIEESPAAQELQQRLRDVTRRLRLGAPQLTGRGMGLDPNTVAEYLDSALAHDRIEEFEKMCLESDVHLAEVAACHQILTMVLREPAQVDPALRDRIYGIAERAKQQAAEDQKKVQSQQPTPGAQATGSLTETGDAARRRPEVPEYLLASRRSRQRRMAALAALAALFIGLLAYGAWRVDLFSGISETPVVAEGQPDSDAPADDAGATSPEESAQGEGGPSVDGGVPVGRKDASIPLDQLPGEEPEQRTAPAVEPAPGEDRQPPDAGQPAEPPMPEPPAKEPADAESPKPAAPAPMPVQPPGVEGKPPADGGGEQPAAPPEPVNVNTEPPAPAEPAVLADAPDQKQIDQIGLLISEQHVVLRFKEGQPAEPVAAGEEVEAAAPNVSGWYRLPPRDTVHVGDRLLSLPTYRPAFTLRDVTLQLVGGTEIEFLPPVDGVPVVRVQYGRLIVTGLGGPASQLILELGENRHTVSFAEAKSVLAVDLTRVPVTGADPASAEAPARVNLYAVEGDLVWDSGDRSRKIAAPAHWRLPADAVQPDPGSVQIPQWLSDASIPSIDKRAARTAEEHITTDKPAELSVAELVSHRRSEVRNLAIRCSVFLGKFEPFVLALEDPEQRVHWDDQIETLRTAMARSTLIAADVRQAMIDRHGELGNDLYHMLWGFTSDELSSGWDRKLVDFLEVDKLALRVVAYWSLRQITGAKLYYQPELPDAQRRRSVQRWREKLQDGEIRYESPVPPVESEDQPPAEPASAEPQPIPAVE